MPTFFSFESQPISFLRGNWPKQVEVERERDVVDIFTSRNWQEQSRANLFQEGN